jgi:hypothetical protein
MNTPKFEKGDRVAIIPQNNAAGTVYNVRNGEKTNGVLYTVELDVPFIPDEPFYYCWEFELKEIHTLQQVRGQLADSVPEDWEE